MIRAKTWDVRLQAQGRQLSVLVDADTKAHAEKYAIKDCATHGWGEAVVLWCIEYPPSRRTPRTHAITD